MPIAPAPMAGGSRGENVTTESLRGVDDATQRMIISTVDISLIVEDTDKTLLGLESLVENYKGYIANSRRWYSEDQPFANITLRVPAASLDAVLENIRGMALKIQSENRLGQDVTEEYVNLNARLRNLEATEKELLALLTEVRENRGKAEDVLAVYREITEIRGQIESLKGRQQYLERMSAMATVQIEIQPKAAPRPAGRDVTWDPLVTISKAWRTLLQVLKVLFDIVVNVIVLSPIVLIPIGILVLFVKLLRRRKRQDK